MQHSPSFGFDDNDDAKLAFVDGLVDPPASFPAGPTTKDGFPLITAAQAFAELTGSPGKGATPPPGTHVHTTSVLLGTTGFTSDRGAVQLPAWQFTFAEATGSMAVLAITPSSVYSLPPPLHPPSGVGFVGQAMIGSGGRTLTVETAGPPSGTGPCDAAYDLQTDTSETAVAVEVDERDIPPPNGEVCSAQAVLVHLTTVLPAPLGPRVLVNADAQAVSVTDR